MARIALKRTGPSPEIDREADGDSRKHPHNPRRVDGFGALYGSIDRATDREPNERDRENLGPRLDGAVFVPVSEYRADGSILKESLLKAGLTPAEAPERQDEKDGPRHDRRHVADDAENDEQATHDGECCSMDLMKSAHPVSLSGFDPDLA